MSISALRTRQYPLLLLLALTTSATVAPFVAYSTVSIYVREQDSMAREKRRLSELAAAFTAALETELSNQVELAEAAASNIALQADDLGAFWRSARQISELVKGHFVLTGPQMQQLVNTRVPEGSVLPRAGNPEAIERILRTGQPYIDDLSPGALTGEVLFPVRAPVRIGGSPKYALSYVARDGSIRKMLQRTFLPPEWKVSVLDRNGRIVARSFRHDEFYGREASREFLSSLVSGSGLLLSHDLEGNAAYSAYQKSDLNGWTVVVWAPEAQITGPAEATKRNLLLGLMIALAASILSALLANRLIRGPSLRLLRTAEALAAGEPVRYAPSFMAEANVVGEALSRSSSVIAQRESALRDRERHLSVVLKEMSHRTKNLLAIIQAIANQSARNASDVDGYHRSFVARISGLARSNDLLVHENSGSVLLSDLIRSQLEPFAGDLGQQLESDGPSLTLRSEAAQSLGMAFHELATNAAKYGSLAVPGGKVLVQWKIDLTESGWFEVTWKEAGGPACSQPIRAGFGQSVLTKVVPAATGGEAEVVWRPDGCEWRLRAPLASVILGEAATGRTAA